MTLEEAIKHAEDKAQRGGKCGEDHAQLAMWLKELQERRAAEPEKRTEKRTETHACDCISRQAAIEALDALCDRECEYSKKQRSVMCGACHLGSAFDVVEQLPSAQTERLTNDDFETIRIHLNAYKEKLCNQQRWEEADEYQRIIDRFMAFASTQPEIEERKGKSAQNVSKEDLISRKAAIDAVNGVIADYIPTLYGRYEALPLEMAMAIKRLPTAQPEIIRCKDCKHWGERGLCDKWDYYISNGDFYCGCAERREG